MSLPGFGAVGDLGLGNTLSQQVKGETDDERKKRMEQMAQQQLLGPTGSQSVTSLFGPAAGGKSAGY